MSVYLYMSILGPLKGLPLNTFENYAKLMLVDPGIEHEPRRFFDAFRREIKTAKIQDSRTSVFVRKHVISKFEIVSSDAVYHFFMHISSLKLCRSM